MREDSDMAKLTFHDLRHTFRSLVPLRASPISGDPVHDGP
jgi:integrase